MTKGRENNNVDDMRLRCATCGKIIEGVDTIVFTATKLEVINGYPALVEFPTCSALCAMDAKRKNIAFWKTKMDVLKGSSIGTCRLGDFFDCQTETNKS